ncbi:MAG TPA: histidine kinase [Acidobacteriota bacterium]|nr:histidine kinase [Acidobacteriota bacterium]
MRCHYADALRDYLREGGEAGLASAYECGREASIAGLGVLDLVRLHHTVLGELESAADVNAIAVLPAAKEREKEFLLEALSPFEAAHRGYRRAHEELRARERELSEGRAHYENLFKEARGMEEALRLLSKRMVYAQEEERKHFSRELHDEVGQALNAMTMNLAALKRLTECATPAAQARIDDTVQLVERTIETVHRFARELRPAMLDELGLEAALRACVRGFSERTGHSVEFHGRLEGNLLAPDQRIVIYRVAQESLNNVAKHASATHVDVILWREGGLAILEIRDNGRGFLPAPRRVEPDRQRLGLLGMEERVRLVNGRFHIGSRPGAGTIVRVEIPLAPEESAPAVLAGNSTRETNSVTSVSTPTPT